MWGENRIVPSSQQKTRSDDSEIFKEERLSTSDEGQEGFKKFKSY